jgi:outer membrane protein OmpA-like peptidoglycan-associated protein
MASVSYLKLLLQPYGSLITVIQMAGKAAGRIQLDPVTFAAGSAELSAEATPYLTQVSKLLEKKSIHMQLCGFATMEDLTALSKGKENVIPPAGHPALEALAKQRAESIKSELVNNHGVLSKQLFVCHPELDRTAQASPRAELSI